MSDLSSGSARSQSPAPAYDSLPRARSARRRGGTATREIVAQLENVTPIFGGAVRPRETDAIDVIRAATVRGHLRFWWRALHAAECLTPEALFERESKLWGRAATNQGGRSCVDLRVRVERVSDTDKDDIDLQRTPGAYALWPARSEKKFKPPAPRRSPGTRFELTLITTAEHELEVLNAARAWILFGGYGGRTRRGLGSLRARADANTWLPLNSTRDSLTCLFEHDVLEPLAQPTNDVPWLGGAALHVGRVEHDAIRAWTTALNWLKTFRQGTNGAPGDRAREPAPGRGPSLRPSISNWPEADKVRHLREKLAAHPPRHSATPAWPRAGFGLPIVGKFQCDGRYGQRYDEPGSFTLGWYDTTLHDRLASPLIVKALPLADGSFAPCALWLTRAYPVGSEVRVDGEDGSGAPFDRLIAADDRPLFEALEHGRTLREAFLAWLQKTYKTTAVAP